MDDAMQASDRIGRRMKLHDLHVLMTVVQTGSMSKAAAMLNTGQSAISRSIADLEAAFGVLLLDRSHHGVKPTPYGRALLDGGTAVFDDLRQTVKNIEFLSDPTAGELRVGCNHVLAASFVSVVVDRLSRRYPRAVFHLVTAHVGTQQRELIERNLDLLVARKLGLAVDERFNYEFLFEESYSIFVGTRNRWARRRAIDLAELANEPWVLPPAGSASGSVAIEAFRANGLDCPRAAVVAELADVRKSLLMAGRFISIFPESILQPPVRRPELKALSIKQPLISVPVGIFTLKNRAVGTLAKMFVEASRDLAKELMTRKGDGRNRR
jgi:DNA-binding transcriptional LysR family regulator